MRRKVRFKSDLQVDGRLIDGAETIMSEDLDFQGLWEDKAITEWGWPEGRMKLTRQGKFCNLTGYPAGPAIADGATSIVLVLPEGFEDQRGIAVPICRGDNTPGLIVIIEGGRHVKIGALSGQTLTAGAEVQLNHTWVAD